MTTTTIVFIANYLGSRHGGINVFNASLIRALQKTAGVKTVCLVPSTECVDSEDAKFAEVSVLRSTGGAFLNSDDDAKLAVEQLAKYTSIGAIVGHDVVTGELALAIGAMIKTKTILFCHMAYAQYISLIREPANARLKEIKQAELFRRADQTFAVGPLLLQELLAIRRTAILMNEPKMILPPMIDMVAPTTARKPPRLLYSGRIETDNDVIKQAELAAMAMGRALHEPSGALDNSTVDMYGFEEDSKSASEFAKLISTEAGYRVPVRCLPFNSSRQGMLDAVANASVLVMPSVHEGFGLVAWEAMCLNVPVVASTNSGFYKLLEANGLASFISGITVRALNDDAEAEVQINQVAKRIRQKIEFSEDAFKSARDLSSAVRTSGMFEKTLSDFLSSCGAVVGLEERSDGSATKKALINSNIDLTIHVDIGVDGNDAITPILESTIRKVATALRAAENGIAPPRVSVKSSYLVRLQDMAESDPDEELRMEAAVTLGVDSPKIDNIAWYLNESFKLLSLGVCDARFPSESDRARAFEFLVKNLKGVVGDAGYVRLAAVRFEPYSTYRISFPKEEIERMSFYEAGWFTTSDGITLSDLWDKFSVEIIGGYLLGCMGVAISSREPPSPLGNLEDWLVGTP